MHEYSTKEWNIMKCNKCIKRLLIRKCLATHTIVNHRNKMKSDHVAIQRKVMDCNAKYEAKHWLDCNAINEEKHWLDCNAICEVKLWLDYNAIYEAKHWSDCNAMYKARPRCNRNGNDTLLKYNTMEQTTILKTWKFRPIFATHLIGDFHQTV